MGNNKDEITLVVHIKRTVHKKLKIYCAVNSKTIQNTISSLIEDNIK